MVSIYEYLMLPKADKVTPDIDFTVKIKDSNYRFFGHLFKMYFKNNYFNISISN